MLSSLCHSTELKHRVLGQNSEMQWSGKSTTVQNEVRHPLLQVSLKLIALFTPGCAILMSAHSRAGLDEHGDLITC